jgi:hypothetical protein
LFNEHCESRFWWRIGVELYGEQRDVERIKLYEVGGNEGRAFFANGEKLSSCLLLIMMCGVCLEFHSNHVGDKSPSRFLLLLNMAFTLPLCQEC